jgi:ubiquinone/menaquinone biosynthesis C-methylase UbiE
VGLYREHVVPRLVERTCGSAGFDRWRTKATGGLVGRVVEVGFGSGLNMGLYPPEVTRVLAVEPALVARQRASRRIAAGSVPVEFVGLDGQQLPLEDASCDGALFTFTLCTVADPARALG